MNWLVQCGIRFYGATLSHIIGGQCRFYPSCSDYAFSAFEQHSFWRACTLAIARIAKCHPWHPGGIDMVPTKNHEG